MPVKSESLQNITMSGDGLYSLATRGAEDVINKSIPLTIDVLNSMSITKEMGYFTFSDIGTADGGTSLKLVERIINSIRKKSPKIDINIFYADQPKNDFNSLVQTVLGLGHFPSYLENIENVVSHRSD